MRIIAGHWRGRELTPVGKGDAAAALRPTSDRVRESLFSILASRELLEGASVLDLFAGTGALALEALSRGAARAVLVENGRAALRLMAQNIHKLKADDLVEVWRYDAAQLGRCPQAGSSLIFLDPPYDRGLGSKALKAARMGGWLAPGAHVIWEEAKPQQAPAGFTHLETRRFGQTYITFLQAC